MPARDTDTAARPEKRALLLRHCYLNPTAFSRYRAHFTRAAFRVVACPRLTQNKNSADIHMVMDILDALRHDTRFDEFIFLSGDSDFMPVLLRLRLHDRQTVVLMPGPAGVRARGTGDARRRAWRGGHARRENSGARERAGGGLAVARHHGDGRGRRD